MSQLLRKLLSPYMNEADAGEGDGDAAGGAADDQENGNAVDPKSEGETDKDKPKPTDAEAKLLKEVMDKKNKLKKTEEELAQVKATIKGLEELGGVEALKELAKKQKELEKKEMEEKGEWTRLKAQMAEEHEKDIRSKIEALEAEQKEKQRLQSQISELTIGSAFAGSEFIRERLVMPLNKVKTLYGSHFEYQDGKVVAYDKPAGSDERTMLVDGAGNPLAFDLAMAKIIDADADRDHLLKSKAKPGSGSHTNKKTTDADSFSDAKGIAKITNALDKGALKPAK